MQYPKISIVTPSYNQGTYIKQTIDSVLGQNYPNLEYWIIDGGSMDNTIEILKSYGDLINWISEKDNGQTEAINKGFLRATGDIVAFLNSDDYYLPDTLNKVVKIFNETQCVWMTGNYRIVDQDNQQIQSFVSSYKQFLQLFSSPFTLSITNYINQPSTFWKKELFSEIGTFDEHLSYTMDYDFWMRAIQKHPLHTTKEILSAFRIHATSKGSIQFTEQFEEELQVLKKYNANSLLWILHKLHNQGIIWAYRMIK